MYVDVNAAGCPNTCRHCSVDGHLPYGNLFSLEELRLLKTEWGPLTIRFEPTAHPDFPEIYHSDIAIDFGGWLVTNGFGLARREDYCSVLKKMLAMGFHTIAFTLHGLPEHHDWFVCRAGAFDDILLATRRVRQAGFAITWQIFVDKSCLTDLPQLIDTAYHECGEFPHLELPYHRVGGRTWHYEKLRLTLQDVEAHRLHSLLGDPHKNIFIESVKLTASAWLEKWRSTPISSDFRHPFEPPAWPPNVAFESLSIRISRDRKVFFDPLCSPPIYLGNLSEGKIPLIERLEKLPAPLYSGLAPKEVTLSPTEQEQLHPSGFSLRYKEINQRYHARP